MKSVLLATVALTASLSTACVSAQTDDGDPTTEASELTSSCAAAATGDHYEFLDDVTGGSIPREFISACDKGFKEGVRKGTLIGFPIVGIRCAVNDGASHAVDSSEMAFKTAALMGFREAYAKASPTILEPIMKVEIDVPTEYQGSVVGQVNQRRGTVLETIGGDTTTVVCEVPLNAMFGYSTDLRSATQGKGTFTMEFARYAIVPKQEQEEMKKVYREKLAAEAKAK